MNKNKEILNSLKFNMNDNFVSKYSKTTIIQNNFSNLQNYIFDSNDNSFNDYTLLNSYLDLDNINDSLSLNYFLSENNVLSLKMKYLNKQSNSKKTKLLLPTNKENQEDFRSVLSNRKTTHKFSKKKLTIKKLSDLLFFSLGINKNRNNKRFYASAGGLYPIFIYFYANNIENLVNGIYRYHPVNHELEFINKLNSIDVTKIFASNSVSNFKYFNLIIFYVFNNFLNKYKYSNSSSRFGLLETGAIIHNIDLNASWQKIGINHVGYFNIEEIKKMLKISDYFGLYITNVSVLGEL